MSRIGVVILCLTIVTNAWAYSSNYGKIYDFESDGIYYRFNADKSSVSVTYRITYYNQHMTNISASYTGDVVIPESVTNNDKVYPVTAIDWYAFNNSLEVTSVSIPNTITTIGERAFYGCSSLKTIDLPESITQIDIEAFQYSGLESFTIPPRITSIPQRMFAECQSLKSVTFHENVVSIGGESF